VQNSIGHFCLVIDSLEAQGGYRIGVDGNQIELAPGGREQAKETIIKT
jgi:hypothetical protein